MIKSFTIGAKHHVNLGNYESMEVEAQVTMDCEDFETLKVTAQVALAELLNSTFQAQSKPSWFAQIPMKRAKMGGA